MTENGSKMRAIPYGQTISYDQLARRIGQPTPVGADGSLTGYGGGLPIKRKLLALENRQLPLL
jgi:methylated-DNA-[protein]-cysteine S-methyltransferase